MGAQHKPASEKAAEKYYNTLAQIGKADYEQTSPYKYSVLSDAFDLWKRGPFLPDTLNRAFSSVESGLQDTYANAASRQEGALLERMKSSGLNEQMNPAAMATILGQQRQQSANALAQARTNIGLEKARLGFQWGNDIMRLLIGQGQQGVSNYMGGLGGAAGGLAGIGAQQAQRGTNADWWLGALTTAAQVPSLYKDK